MARIRSVHPALFTDEAWVSCSPMARLLFIGLWTDADDGGAFEWKPLQIKMRIFPADELAIEPLLDELAENDLIRPFSLAGRPLGAIKDFLKYQSPRKPTIRFQIPENLEAFVNGDPDDQPDLFAGTAPVRRQCVTGSPRRGEEGRGEGEEGTRAKRATALPEDFPDQEAIAYAESQFSAAGVNISASREAERFRDRNLAKGERYKDWRAAWRQWVRNAISYAEQRGGGAPRQAVVHELAVPLQQQRNWMREYMHGAHTWRPERGPPPSDPGCKISAEVMAEFGYTPPRNVRASG